MKIQKQDESSWSVETGRATVKRDPQADCFWLVLSDENKNTERVALQFDDLCDLFDIMLYVGSDQKRAKSLQKVKREIDLRPGRPD